MAIPISYNLRNMKQRPASTATAVIGIGLVVAVFIGALALSTGFRKVLIATGSPDNIIALRAGADAEISSGVSRETANVLGGLPEIAADKEGRPLFSPEVVVLVNQKRLDGHEAHVTVRGIDPSGFALRDKVKMVEGRTFEPGATEIIVGRRVLGRYQGIAVGSRVKLSHTEFTVVGAFEADGSAFESEIWGDNKVLMPIFRGEVFQSVTFRLRDPSVFEDLKKRVESDPRTRVDLKREREFYADQSELLARVIEFCGIFITIIMGFGAVFAAMNTMYAAVASRTRDVAVLLTLGFRPWAVMLSFVLESIFVALVGGMLGCLLALPINGIKTATTNWASFSELSFAFQVTPQALATGLIVAGLIGLVGGILPARRAARQPLATSLREL